MKFSKLTATLSFTFMAPFFGGACVGSISSAGGSDKDDNAAGVGADRLQQRVWLHQEDEVRALAKHVLGFEVQGVDALVTTPSKQYSNNAYNLELNSVFADWMLTFSAAAAAQARDQVASISDCNVSSEGEAVCAEEIARMLTLRAYKNPATEEHIQGLLGLFNSADNVSFEDGLELMVQAVFLSPNFLYRFELGTPDDSRFRLTSREIAELMAWMLTGAPPDEALMADVTVDALGDADVREAHARRLLAQLQVPLEQFAVEWLKLQKVSSAAKDTSVFPNFSATLAADMVAETSGFLARVLADETTNFQELFTAPYTWGSPELAALYKVEHPTGAGIERLVLNAAQRSGFFTQASVMANYASPSNTSPTRRGVFVWRTLLCQELADPPPNIQMTLRAANDPSSAREFVAQHASEPSCNSCHHSIDPIGLGLENYDAIGAYRTTENGAAIDATGSVEGQVDFNGAVELSQWLAESELARDCFAKNAASFLLGSEFAAVHDSDWLNQANTAYVNYGNHFVDLVVGLVRAEEFIVREPM